MKKFSKNTLLWLWLATSLWLAWGTYFYNQKTTNTQNDTKEKVSKVIKDLKNENKQEITINWKKYYVKKNIWDCLTNQNMFWKEILSDWRKKDRIYFQNIWRQFYKDCKVNYEMVINTNEIINHLDVLKTLAKNEIEWVYPDYQSRKPEIKLNTYLTSKTNFLNTNFENDWSFVNFMKDLENTDRNSPEWAKISKSYSDAYLKEIENFIAENEKDFLFKNNFNQEDRWFYVILTDEQIWKIVKLWYWIDEDIKKNVLLTTLKSKNEEVLDLLENIQVTETDWKTKITITSSKVSRNNLYSNSAIISELILLIVLAYWSIKLSWKYLKSKMKK